MCLVGGLNNDAEGLEAHRELRGGRVQWQAGAYSITCMRGVSVWFGLVSRRVLVVCLLGTLLVELKGARRGKEGSAVHQLSKLSLRGASRREGATQSR